MEKSNFFALVFIVVVVAFLVCVTAFSLMSRTGVPVGMETVSNLISDEKMQSLLSSASFVSVIMIAMFYINYHHVDIAPPSKLQKWCIILTTIGVFCQVPPLFFFFFYHLELLQSDLFLLFSFFLV